MQRIWIVGGSSGIGLELVKQWLKAGHKVIVSARSASDSRDLAALMPHFPDRLNLINMDVTDPHSAAQAANQAWQCYDGLDLWFFNAAIYDTVRLPEWDPRTFASIMNVNYLGCVNVMSTLAPLFKAQGSGRWVWNVSLASYFGLPYGSAYSAPKAALMNLAESVQPELARENIRLQIINHGFVKTRLTSKNDFEMPQLMTPEYTAQTIAKAIETDRAFEIRFPFGLAFFLRALRFLPYTLSLALTRKMLK
jgi:NAD(P)-dependent dehydrogenase (short-subunit alcohol dehydrogenase family)